MADGASSVYRWFTMMVARVKWISGLTAALRELAPYAAIALQLPGGALIVTSLWILQRLPWLFAQARRGG